MGSLNFAMYGSGMGMRLAERALDRFDKDDSDSLDKGEFRKMMTKMGGLGGLLSSNAAFKKADTNKDGEVDQDELAAFMQKMTGKKKCCGKDKQKDMLKKLLEMMGVDPQDLKGKSLSELKDMLDNMMQGKGNCGGGGSPQGQGGGGSPCGGGGSPAPQGQGGGCNPTPTPTPYCPPAPIDHDSGGGNKKDKVASGADIKADMKSSDDNCDGKLNRAEFGTAMDKLNDRAANAGSDSFLNEAEKNNLFNRFDKNGDGVLSSSEQRKLNNYITSGNQNNFLDNKLTVGDWNKMNNVVPN